MERADENIPIFVAQTGPLSGQRWMIEDTMIVGRDPGCDIEVPNRQVSRHHARLTPTPEGVLLEDLGSKNGTHYNGEMIAEPIVLKDGDTVQIAFAQQFVFLSSDATLPLEAIEEPRFQPDRKSRLFLDKRSRRVWIGNEEVLPPLSVAQFQLLDLLFEQEQEVVSRKEIINKIWGVENAIDVSEQALDALVRRLRDRLAMIDPDHAYIVTIRGHGLRLENPQE